MNYKVQVTEAGKSWTLPSIYTYQQAEWEVKMQQELNRVNALLGEAPATIEIVEIN